MAATVIDCENDWVAYEAFKANLRRLGLNSGEYEAALKAWCDEHDC